MSELTPASVKKLKVAELRAELTNLGLDTKGNKPVLLERLLEAIAAGKDDTEHANESGNALEISQEEPQIPANDTVQQQPAEVVENDKPSEEVSVEKMDQEEAKVDEPNEPEVAAIETESKEESLPETSEKVIEPVSEEMETKVEDSSSVTEQVEKKEESPKAEEPMDQTPSAPAAESKEAPKAPEPVDFDTSVDFSKVEEEPDVELDDSLVVLDKYNSDLFVKINPDGLGCSVMQDNNIFIYVFGGVRTTWGVTSGKVCYEVKFEAMCPEVSLDASEEPSHFIRVGWSLDSANLQLGEDQYSYGYDSSGKKCANSEFTDWGQAFAKDDVVTCYLDLESEVKKISFSKNGEDLGDAFELPEDIQGKALFPHVVIRNTQCSLNFGSKEEAWFAPKEEYTFIQNASDEAKVRATCGPTDKKDCEVVMMIGLPASGKSTWAKKHVAENPDKKYNILGTSMVLDRMKLLGVARKQENNKNMDKAAKCLHRLFEIATSKKRNYILDQTNVYQTAQNKKIRSFEGFKKKAIVCIPDQEVLKQRIQERKNEGLELPHNAICDMKRNFVLPSTGDQFEEVSYIDQDEEQSKKIVAEYIKEGNSQRIRTYSGSGEPDRKRPRQDYRPRHYGGGGGGWGGGSHRDYRRYDDRRGGYRSPQSNYNRRGGGGYYQHGRGGRGGFRDNYRGGRGGHQGGGYHDRNRQGGNRNYSSGKSYGGSSYGGGSNQQRQQYSYNTQQQQQNYSQQQQQNQQQSYGNYNQYAQYQQNYQQYSQQAQQTSPQTQSYQQYPQYYQQQGTYQQGGYSGYGY